MAMGARDEARVVLVHDWLTGMRGGEKCLESACRRWPQAPLYTLLHRPGSVSPLIEGRGPHTSFLQLLPAVHRYYRYLLPLMPAAVAGLRLPPCDLVLSFSHCAAKAVRPPQRLGQPAPHVCYCFTPMRYAWHMQEAYFQDGSSRGLKARVRDGLLALLRAWDRHTADGVSHFIAISRTVQRRIADCYQRDSVVIYPPVDTDFYHPGPEQRESHYLVVSAFAPYKRLDLAIAACNRLRRTLVVIGTGQDRARLQALAGPTIHFLGWQPDEVIRSQLRRCQALLFPGEEDFGIVPLEAHACGTPVIALGRGGVTETVVPAGGRGEPTGVFFAEQTVEGITAAIADFERRQAAFSPHVARRQALRFSKERFERELFAYLESVLRPGLLPLRQAA
jgi:glycosyltransferase involved in cell wall biosynthesis